MHYEHFSPSHQAFLAAISTNDEPTSYSQTTKHAAWRDAMAQELAALEANKTWTLEPLPEGKKLVGCKWAYRVKYKPNGEVDKYKARLVAKRYTQIEGEDFTKTFAPVAKMTTVRCLVTVAVSKGWSLHQMGVSNAFLHGDLHEEVYMEVPLGYKTQNKGLVCHLHKSLYGLKQGSRNWYAKLSEALTGYGFSQSSADHSLFTFNSSHVFIAVLIYVDDLVIAGNDNAACESFKKYLHTCFHMKDLGALKYFLGLELASSPNGLFLCQRKYALDILQECGMLDCKPCLFPMEQHHHLSTASGAHYSNPAQYRRLVGRLIYLTITWPELSYYVHILSQFMQAPQQDHWNAAMRVLRYIKSSPGQGIWIPKHNDLTLVRLSYYIPTSRCHSGLICLRGGIVFC